MDYVPTNLNISTLKRKTDISALTVFVAGENVRDKGRFVMLWRDGNFIVIQAEPWWRPSVVSDKPPLSMSHYLEENRALWHIQEVIQTMLDTLVLDGEHNWAYLVRLKDKSYRLVYKQRRLIHNCPIWTKVVELDDIEMTRFASGLCWEGVYEGEEVDLFIAWQDDWGHYIAAESRGQKLMHSMGVGHYFFDLKAHVSKNGVIVGIMMEPIVGQCITHADLSAIFEAVGDIQRHGIFFSFQICDIYMTEQGVRFASASSARYYRDPEVLAEKAQWMWQTLAEIFNEMDNSPWRDMRPNSRSMSPTAFIVPRLPSPDRPIIMTLEDARVRLIWSITTSDEFCHISNSAFAKYFALRGSAEHLAVRRRDKRNKGDSRALLPPDDFSEEHESSVARTGFEDEPLAVGCARYHPYVRPRSNRLLLPREHCPTEPTT